MNITVNRNTFAKALQDIMPFIPSKPAIQILKCCKITTKGSKMKLEANDAQNSISTYIDVLECDTDGSFCVDAADLNKYISAVKSSDIAIKAGNESVMIKHEKGESDFAIISADEFPSFKMGSEEISAFQIPAGLLSECVKNASIFVSQNTIRPVMCAIYATIKGGEFTYAASDTHKLIYGKKKVDIPENIDAHWFIMPTAFRSIIKSCKNIESVLVSISEAKASYHMGDTIINTILANGKYPDVTRVIPQTHNMELTTEKSDIADALNRISMFCGTSRCAKIAISPMDMTISGSDLISAKSASENIIHGGCTAEMSIGVNVDYLVEILSTMNDGEINIALVDSSRPIKLTQESKADVTIIIMPMQLAQ